MPTFEISSLIDPLFFIAEYWLAAFQFDLTRYLIGAGGVFVLVNVLLAKRLAGRKIRQDSPGRNQMVREFWASVRTVAVFATSGLITLALKNAGIVEFYDQPGERGWAYFVFSILALMVLHDAWFYWTHRAIHHPKLFRRVHRLHHKSNNPTPWTAYSFDIGEAAINALYMPLVLSFLPVSYLGVFIFSWAHDPAECDGPLRL